MADNTFAWETWEAPDGRFLYCSPSCLRITGYSREEFTGDSTLLGRIVHPEDRGRILSHLSSVDAAPAHAPLVFRIVRLDGAIRWIEHECQPIHAEDGTFLGRRGSHRDHTERRNLELQILRMQRQESLGRIASGVAHDLNNILSPIMMAGDLLQGSALDPAAQRYVELLRSSAARGADLVKQLLLYSRGIDGQPSDVDLSEEVRSAIRLVTETFPKHIDVRLNLPSDKSPIRADPTQLQQVVLNLCVNARDAMPESGTLTLSVERVELDEEARLTNPNARPGVYAVLAVADTGTGIPADVLDNIFDPFFTTKPLGQGSGLGLSTVQGIVAAHGGFVEVRTQPDGGSQFSVYFPSAPSVAQRAATADLTPPPHRGNGQLILVVDDEKIVGEMTQRLLHANGYTVLRADGGLQAIEIFSRKRESICAVLTDLCMPQLDGFATIQRLAELDENVRVLAVSGLEQLRDKALNTSPVVRRFLAKPWQKNQLLAALHEVLTATDRRTIA